MWLDYGLLNNLYGLNYGWLLWLPGIVIRLKLHSLSNPITSSFGGPALVDEVFSPETVIMGG